MPKRNLIWILAVAGAAVVAVWVTRPTSELGVPHDDDFQGVVRTYELLRDRHYQPPPEDALSRAAVRGMVQALDEFSSYIPPEDVTVFRRRVTGEQSGLGLRLEVAEGQVRVVGPLPDSPAHLAGIASGDVLLAVDGVPVAGLSLKEVERMIAGPVGTEVLLVIDRPEADRPLRFELTRRAFPVETVQGLRRAANGRWIWTLGEEDDLAYVRLAEFVEQTPAQLRQAVGQLDRARALILDLRDNPGGLPDAAVKTANFFLTDGVITEVVPRQGPPRIYRAHADGTCPGALELIVLVNGRSASGAEIVAGALQAHHRAVVLGTRTRGKGCVQSMFDLPDGLGQVNLTTQEFLLAGGRAINRRPGSARWGVQPDVEIPLTPEQERRLRRLRWRVEALSAPRPETAPDAPATGPGVDPPSREFLAIDPQLSEAVVLLTEVSEVQRILRRAADARNEAPPDVKQEGDR